MPEIQVKDKLITLEELGAAYNNITPANIGAVSTSAVIDVPHGGTGATTKEGALSNLFHDDQASDAQYLVTMKAGWIGGNIQLPLDPRYGGTGATTAANARANLEITPANIGAVSTSAVIDVPHGGTGATTPAQARANLGLTPSAPQMIATGIYVIKVGNLAFINCDGDNAIALPPKTWATLGYLPNGYVPAGHFYGTILNGGQGEQSGIIHIMDSGTIQYFNSGTAQATALWGSMIFPITNN